MPRTENPVFPETIDIGGRRWTIRTQRTLIRYRGERIGGICDPEKREIIISRAVSPRRQVEIFVHELTHACCDDLNEEAVRRIEDTIMDGLRRSTIPKGVL